MPSHDEQQVLPYNTQQMFDLVADIERYPEFLPWCKAARILERREGELVGELAVRFAHMTERYTSRVTLQRPAQPGDTGAIDVTMIQGPFEHLTNRWQFTRADGGTQVDFFIDFKFRSRLLEKLIGGMFGKATDKMIDAFRQRAEALYGNQEPET